MVMSPNIAMSLPPNYRDPREEFETAGIKPPPGKGSGGLGNTNSLRRGGQRGGGVYQNIGGTAGLPTVTDPDQAFADITRQEYLDYVNNFRGFEEQLIDQAQTDTSLIDQAREDIEVAQGLAEGISARNVSRYGTSLTPAQRQQQGVQLQRANTLGGIQSVNDARVAQREANTRLLADLINIGQNVNRSSISQLGSAAADATNRKNAFTAARAQSKANTYQTMATLGSSAILAAAVLF
ncbi:MAG: hypothetical protein CL581_15740 [Alteromonadaceae bacterium]|nr:hypothetical protein [Alteromonadaceae bacterium]